MSPSERAIIEFIITAMREAGITGNQRLRMLAILDQVREGKHLRQPPRDSRPTLEIPREELRGALRIV